MFIRQGGASSTEETCFKWRDLRIVLSNWRIYVQAYLASEEPRYPTGFGLSLALGTLGLFVAFFLEWTYKVGNAKKARIADEARVNYTEEQLFDLGDKSPLFKYVL